LAEETGADLLNSGDPLGELSTNKAGFTQQATMCNRKHWSRSAVPESFRSSLRPIFTMSLGDYSPPRSG